MKKRAFASFSRRGFRTLIISGLSLTVLTGCVKDEYDLSKGIDTEMTVGGDSLLLPLGSILPVRLDSMINREDIELLKHSENGDYFLQKKDSSMVSVNSINPVLVSIAPVSVSPSVVTIANLDFPEFKLADISTTANVLRPSFDLSNTSVAPISESKSATTQLVVSSPSPVRAQVGTIKRAKAAFSVGPFTPQSVHGSFNQQLDFTYPMSLQKIQSVTLATNAVKIRIDKSGINQLGFTTKTEIINFRIDFPQEYTISNAVGTSSRIEGSSFIVENATFTANENFVDYQFNISSLNLSNVPQASGAINYAAPITYDFGYSLSGTVENASNINGKDATMTVTINSSPTVQDVNLITKDIVLNIPKPEDKVVDQTISGIPASVSHVGLVSFSNGAYVKLNISKPDLGQFDLINGTFNIQLPTSFKFKAGTPYLNTSNLLSLPYDKLFGDHLLYVTGIMVDQDVVNNTVVVKDKVTYSADNMTLGSRTTTLSDANKIPSSQDMIFAGSFVSFKVEDAAVKTDKIVVDVAEKSSKINVSKQINASGVDILKFYSATLTEPAKLTLKLDVSGLPAAFDSLYFKNYTITFPSWLKFKEGSVNAKNQIILNRGFGVKTALADNSVISKMKMFKSAVNPLTLDEGFVITNGKGTFTKTLYIEKFDFGDAGLTLKNNLLAITENNDVNLKGSIYVNGKSLNAKDVGSITVSPSISVADLTIGKVDAQVSPAIDPVNKTIELNLPDFLKQSGTKLSFAYPYLSFEVGNTTGVPVNVNMDIIPKKAGVVIPGTISTSLSVSEAAVAGKYTWSKFWLAAKDTTIRTPNFAFAEADLATLLKGVPDQLIFNVKSVVDQSKHHIIDLNSPLNEVKVKYDFHVPFNFGKDFEITYVDTVADLKKDMNDLAKYINQVKLLVDVTNAIPLDLTLNVTLLDASKKAISTDKIEILQSATIKSCNIATQAATTTQVDLGLKQKVEGALKEVDAVQISVKAKATSSLIPLKAAQSVSVKLKAMLPNGITVTDDK